jgi:hypothetical protein
LLLEIQHWARHNPMDLEASLDHLGTVFYKIVPAVSTAAAPDAEDQSFDAADLDASDPSQRQSSSTTFALL